MYKLIFLDYELGNNFNGPEVAKAIRELIEAEAQHVQQPYICCCTAYEAQTYEQKAYESGMNNILRKPVVFEQLSDIIDQAGI